MRTSTSNGSEDIPEEYSTNSLFAPFEMDSGTCLDDSKLIQRTKDMQSHNIQEIQCDKVIHVGNSVMIKQIQEHSFDSVAGQEVTLWPTVDFSICGDEFDGYVRMMEMKGLKFELPVTSVLRATKFSPFQKATCTPIRFGITLMTGAHMRGF